MKYRSNKTNQPENRTKTGIRRTDHSKEHKPDLIWFCFRFHRHCLRSKARWWSIAQHRSSFEISSRFVNLFHLYLNRQSPLQQSNSIQTWNDWSNVNSIDKHLISSINSFDWRTMQRSHWHSKPLHIYAAMNMVSTFINSCRLSRWRIHGFNRHSFISTVTTISPRTNSSFWSPRF